MFVFISLIFIIFLIKSIATWQSYLYDLPAGTMKWLINSSIDTLPTRANLKRWGKCPTDKCPHCGNRETTNHILNCCKVYLNQQRYTWRHNNIINYIVSNLDKTKYSVYSDIPGYTTAAGGSIPPHILVTGRKPDIVIVSECDKKLISFELTVPFETRIGEANRLKTETYAQLEADLNQTGYKATITAFEIGSRGLVTPENRDRLRAIHSLLTPNKPKLKTFIENISSLAVISSYFIFLSRKEPSWNENTPYVQPVYRNQ